MVIDTWGPEETRAFGKKMGQEARPGQVICLNGDLGVGKTIFTQGFAEGLIHVPTVDAIAYNMWGASGLICPIMDAKRCQVYTGLYHMENGIETVMEQCPMDMGELIEQLNKQSERVIFLGDGVPVYKAMIEEKMTVPYVFAPAQMNRQRASCVAALGMKALTEGYTGAKVQPADEFVPDYLRKSQAERQREAEASPDGQAGKLPGDY